MCGIASSKVEWKSGRLVGSGGCVKVEVELEVLEVDQGNGGLEWKLRLSEGVEDSSGNRGAGLEGEVEVESAGWVEVVVDQRSGGLEGKKWKWSGPLPTSTIHFCSLLLLPSALFFHFQLPFPSTQLLHFCSQLPHFRS